MVQSQGNDFSVIKLAALAKFRRIVNDEEVLPSAAKGTCS